MKKIVFGITSLTLGGAERVLVDMVNQLNKDYEISILMLYPGGEFEKLVSPNVKLVHLYNKAYEEMSKWEKIRISLSLLFFKNYIYRTKVKKENAVEIAFLEGPITRLFSSPNKKTKKIAWIHNDIEKVFGKDRKSKIKKIYDKHIYDQFEKLIFVSQDNKEKFQKVYPNILKEKLDVIYNYIDAQNVRKKAKEEKENLFKENIFSFVSVARLVEQKAIDRFVNIHAKLIQEGLMHMVYIIGEGPQRKELEKQIQQLGVEDTFLLLGKKENPYPYIQQANIFCLLSYYEGYGMVLEEAKILGKDIIITNTAAREALQGYSSSTIVENTQEGIYEGLKKMVQQKRQDRAKEYENNEYRNEAILEQIKKVVGE